MEGPEYKRRSPCRLVQVEIKQTCLPVAVKALQAGGGVVPTQLEVLARGSKGTGGRHCVSKNAHLPHPLVAVQ